MKNIIIKCFAVLLCLVLAGCEIPPESENKFITIKTHDNINEKMALTVDIVQVYDKTLYTQLNEMSSHLFLQKKESIISSNPDGLSVWSVDLQEGQTKSFKLPFNKNFWGVIVFIHFLQSSVEGKLAIGRKMKRSLIIIQDQSFSLQRTSKLRVCKHLHVGQNI